MKNRTIVRDYNTQKKWRIAELKKPAPPKPTVEGNGVIYHSSNVKSKYTRVFEPLGVVAALSIASGVGYFGVKGIQSYLKKDNCEQLSDNGEKVVARTGSQIIEVEPGIGLPSKDDNTQAVPNAFKYELNTATKTQSTSYGSCALAVTVSLKADPNEFPKTVAGAQGAAPEKLTLAYLRDTLCKPNIPATVTDPVKIAEIKTSAQAILQNEVQVLENNVVMNAAAFAATRFPASFLADTTVPHTIYDYDPYTKVDRPAPFREVIFTDGQGGKLIC